MERAVKGWEHLKVAIMGKKARYFPTNQRDIKHMMELYAMQQGQTKQRPTESYIHTESQCKVHQGLWIGVTDFFGYSRELNAQTRTSYTLAEFHHMQTRDMIDFKT